MRNMVYNPQMTEQVLSKTEAKQRAYYDEIASTYDEHYAGDHNITYRNKIFREILGRVESQGTRVLDAMCGGGQNSAYFIERGYDVMGIDISENQCQHYRQRFPNNEIVCGSALKSGLPDESFDIVFTDSLHHLHPYLDDGIREFHRVLRPGGRLIAWEPSAGSLVDHARKLWYKLDRTYFEDNEASIDVGRLAADHANEFELERAIYGGNVGYLFVGLSMALRIPIRWVDRYAAAALRLEELITPLQTQKTSLWVMVSLRKRPA